MHFTSWYTWRHIVESWQWKVHLLHISSFCHTQTGFGDSYQCNLFFKSYNILFFGSNNKLGGVQTHFYVKPNSVELSWGCVEVELGLWQFLLGSTLGSDVILEPMGVVMAYNTQKCLTMSPIMVPIEFWRNYNLFKKEHFTSWKIGKIGISAWCLLKDLRWV